MNQTVQDAERLVTRFQAVAEETRLQIVQLLAAGERCVCELQDELGAAQSRLSFHLRKLREAGVVSDRRDGRWVHYSLVPEALEEMRAFLGEVTPRPGEWRPESCCTPTRNGSREGGSTTVASDIKQAIQRKYANAALTVLDGGGASCCGSKAKPDGGFRDPITRDLYDQVTTSELPERAVLASLGCGNPTALAELHPGEVVLDLGSGGGIDVLLSARRVGAAGKAYGLDATDEMLALARRNAEEAGAENVEFLKGDMESIPLPDASVDVIISNCVVNLSTDKPAVLREAYRVLKPGGRLAVSDIVVRGGIPPEARKNMELWVGCVAGAMDESEFESYLAESGFDAISIEPTRVYDPQDARGFFEEAGLDVDAFADAVEGRIMAAFVRARKPGP